MITSRALLANDATGTPRVLRTDCKIIAWECREFSTDAEEIGIVKPRQLKDMATLYLWTGTIAQHDSGSSGGDVDIVHHGTVKPVTDVVELAALMLMTTPDPDEEEDRS